MIARLRAFGAFWYDFVIGDDWRVAVGVAGALAVTYAISRTTTTAWWVLPVTVPAVVAVSLWSAARRSQPAERPPGSG